MVGGVIYLKPFNMTVASREQLDEITVLYEQCKKHMSQAGIVQWDDNYPNRGTISAQLEAGDLYCAKSPDGAICAVVTLDEWQHPAWADIQWVETAHGANVVIHGLAIHPQRQGQGLGKGVLAFCERFAGEKGYAGIRLDAFTGNPAAIGMYEKNGYRCAGAVYFPEKIKPYNWYNCYEKTIATASASGRDSNRGR